MGAHFLLLPFVEHGHISPMLNLATQIAAITPLDCKVSFVNATEPASSALHIVPHEKLHNVSDTQLVDHANASSCSSSSNGSSTQLYLHIQNDDFFGDRFQFVTLSSTPPSPDQPPPQAQLQHVSMRSRLSVFAQKLVALEKLQPLIEKMVVESKASGHPISCVVCDVLLWGWVQKVADKHSLKLALLITVNALNFVRAYANILGKGSELEELLVTGFNLPAKGDPKELGLFTARDSPEARREKLKFLSRIGHGIENARAEFLVNSFEQLVEPLLPLIEAMGVKITFIGPSCVHGGGGDNGRGKRRAQLAGSALVQEEEEEEECMAWLGRQEKRSVLYISFGSEGVLEETQVLELAMGIEQSGRQFLWVVRPDLPEESRPPEGFRQRSSQNGRGMFVAWASQRVVLQHEAVGAFLTHSGWNSTLESVICGVPMLCLPLVGDQPLNANLVHSYWQVGLRLHPTGDAGTYTVSRSDVERGVRCVMQSGGCFSVKARHLQHCLQLAAHQPQLNLHAFVHRVLTI